MNIFKQLANMLDSLPNGFPPAADGSDLRLLEGLFTEEEARAAVLLSSEWETAESIAEKAKLNAEDLRAQLKSLARKGLISVRRLETGLGYKLMPFVVGFYEQQGSSLDADLAGLVEDYFLKSFGETLKIQPQFHRVVPVDETIQNGIEVHPFESASALVRNAQSWGVFDCICRKQKALIGEACGHPIDVCMAFYDQPGAFAGRTNIRAVSREEALATLDRAAKAGLVHSVSNSREGIHYMCNCCTCSCGLLRGMAELGITNVMARSAFVNTVNLEACNACATCLDYCQFQALSLETTLEVDPQRCTGCGICVPSCPTAALVLVRRPEAEILPIPENAESWNRQRLAARGKV